MCPSVNRKYTHHCETHRVHDQDGRVARQDAPERLRQRGRRQHGNPHHAGELHQHAKVQCHTVNEKGTHDSPGHLVKTNLFQIQEKLLMDRKENNMVCT